MKTKNIVLTDTAVVAIEALQHSCGTYRYYTDTLTRLFNLVLAQSDEIGMDDTETVHTLRVLEGLKYDLACLAGRDHPKSMACVQEQKEVAEAASVDTASKVEEAFTGVEDPEGAEDDAPRKMLAAVRKAWGMANDLQSALSESVAAAVQAGEKYGSVVSDLCDINSDLEPLEAQLDAILAIDPDTYEPVEPTYRDKAAMFMGRARDSFVSGLELMIDARDCASRITDDDSIMPKIDLVYTEASGITSAVDTVMNCFATASADEEIHS